MKKIQTQILAGFGFIYPIVVFHKKKLVWKTKRKSYNCWGIYEWGNESGYHEITIVEGLSEKDELETLIHELIHAWQSEQGLPLTHGKVFKWWAKSIEINFGIQVK